MPFKRVLVATDFDECSEAAVEQAISITEHVEASMIVMHAVHVPFGYMSSLVGELMTQMQDRARTELAKALDPIHARLQGVQGVLRWGVAWEQILEVAREEHADLIVTGARGRRHTAQMLLGSVAEKVVRLSPVPVLTVHCAPTRWVALGA